MLTEVSIIVKDEDSTLRKKYLHYNDVADGITLSQNCERLMEMIKETLSEFGKTTDNIIVKTNTIWE